MSVFARYLTAFRHISAPVVGVFLLLGASAKADSIVFSNLGPNPMVSGGIAITGADATPTTGYRAIGWGFTSPGDFTITTLDVALAWGSGANHVVFDLDADNGNGFPGQVLESWDLTSLPFFNETGDVTHIASNSVEVQTGKQYWLTVSPGDPTTYAIWYVNTQGNDPGQSVVGNGVGWFDGDVAEQGGFQVSGIPTGSDHTVPEIDPSASSGALVMLCGALLVMRGRRCPIHLA